MDYYPLKESAKATEKLVRGLYSLTKLCIALEAFLRVHHTLI